MTESNCLARPIRPTNEEIANLPLFAGLPLNRIHILKTNVQLDMARQAIEKEGIIGFDTESKPLFTKEAVQNGPHVIQFALLDCAFIIQIGENPPLEFIKAILESEKIVKVGFGLSSDRRQLYRKLGIRLMATVDLSARLRKLRYRQRLGVKSAVAILLKQKLHKPKSVTKSNWAAHELQSKQLLYAANDAFAALTIFHTIRHIDNEENTNAIRCAT